MADQLCTLADVKAALIPSGVTDTGDDTLLGTLIDRCSAYIQSITGRRFVAEPAATYLFDTSAGYVLRVPRGLSAITSIGVASAHQPATGGTYTTVPAASALLRPLDVDRRVGMPPTEVHLSRASSAGYRFYDAENGCSITGTFGFATVPVELVGVAVDAVVSAFVNRGDGTSAVIGAEATAVAPWAQLFAKGTSQYAALMRWRYQPV